MRPESEAKLEKIKKMSVILRVVCAVLLTLVTLIGLGCVVCLCLGRGAVGVGGIFFRSSGLALGHRLGLGAVTAVTFAALFKCFYHLYQLFGDYSRGDVFTRDSVDQIRQFGVACLLWGILSFVWNMSLALSVHPAGTFQAHPDSLVIGVILIVIAWFMGIAVDLREENELTI